MNPLISPWFFYIISISDILKPLLLFVGSCIAVIAFIVTVCIIADDDGYESEESFVKRVKHFLTAGIIMVCVGIFVPSSDTCYKMLAASFITPDNIESVKENTKDLVDYILEVADQLNDSNDKD